MQARLRLQEHQKTFLLEVLQRHFPKAHQRIVYDNILPLSGYVLVGWQLGTDDQRKDIYLAFTASGTLDFELKVEMDHGFYEACLEVTEPNVALQYISSEKIGYLHIKFGDIGHPNSFEDRFNELLANLKPRPRD